MPGLSGVMTDEFVSLSPWGCWGEDTSYDSMARNSRWWVVNDV